MRVLGALGVPRVILTNAAGGINASFATGALMLIDDHINLMGRNPLVGPHDPRLGPRFPDMTEVYSRRLRGLAGDAAAACGIRLEHGVYVAVLGPSYETPAEIRAFRTLGADAVGMSTAPEAIVARHMGVEVLGHFVHHQSCCRRRRSSAAPRRGDGGGGPRPRRVHRAAGGNH